MQKDMPSLKESFGAAPRDPFPSGPGDWSGWEGVPGFPVHGGPSKKLRFIGRLLHRELAPRGADEEGGAQPDLLVYRLWLCRQIRAEVFAPTGEGKEKYFPESLPFVIKELNRLVAHQAFVKEKEYGGDGSARLIAEDGNGSELLHILTEEASCRYGSPRWFSSCPDPGDRFFSEYNRNLLFLLDPDGMRTLFHFPTAQVLGEDGFPIRNLPDFMATRPGLAEFLVPFLVSSVDDIVAQDDEWKNTGMLTRVLDLIRGVPVWVDAIEDRHIDAALESAAHAGNIGIFHDLLLVVRTVPKWEETVSVSRLHEVIRNASSSMLSVHCPFSPLSGPFSSDVDEGAVPDEPQETQNVVNFPVFLVG